MNDDQGSRERPHADTDDAYGHPGARLAYDHLILRLWPQATQEQLQAMVRLGAGAALTLGSAVAVLLGGAHRPLLAVLLLGLAYTGVVAILARHLQRRSGRHRRRETLTMGFDIGVLSLATAATGLSGLAFYPLFLWIMLANGLRFGPAMLTTTALAAIPGFTIASLINGSVEALPVVCAALLFGLLLVPGAMLTSLRRMARTNRELAARKDQAEHIAKHDALTGLANRELLKERLERALLRARRNTSQLAVLFLDLDGFKRVNDSLGHDQGDRLLIAVAECLRSTVREVDTVSRLGGDEFILLIEGYDDESDISAVIDRLSGCARRRYPIDGSDTYVTWSCGIATYPKDGADGNTLIKNADIAMYRAKAQGRNCAVSYDHEMSKQIDADLRLRNELRHAIDSREFFVAYQPLVESDRRRLVGVEALVRWQHPARGALAPGSFLPAALAQRLMPEIDGCVLELAADAIASLEREHPRGLRLAVNLDAQQLASRGFAAKLEQTMERAGLALERLDIELNEAALLEAGSRITGLFETLRSRGVRLVLDDFGTGYSSLGSLHRFPIDLIKIDRSFIAGIPHDPADCAMVDGIISIAARLGLEIAAEGVEREAQRDWLSAHDCRLQQGFLHGGPEDIEALRARLAQTSTSPEPAS